MVRVSLTRLGLRLQATGLNSLTSGRTGASSLFSSASLKLVSVVECTPSAPLALASLCCSLTANHSMFEQQGLEALMRDIYQLSQHPLQQALVAQTYGGMEPAKVRTRRVFCSRTPWDDWAVHSMRMQSISKSVSTLNWFMVAGCMIENRRYHTDVASMHAGGKKSVRCSC